MRIEYTGRRTEVSDRIRALAERRLRKLSRLLRGITDVHVVLAADKHRQLAEVSLHSAGQLTLTATEVSSDAAASLSAALDKLERQAQRAAGRRQEQRRRGPARPTPVWPGPAPAAPAAEARPRVIRSRRSPLKPMTVDEAILEVGSSADGLLVFRDAATERVSVLYRRKDGNLGLIEPEV
jgi:putative sigma-54 modulation protein